MSIMYQTRSVAGHPRSIWERLQRMFLDVIDARMSYTLLLPRDITVLVLWIRRAILDAFTQACTSCFFVHAASKFYPGWQATTTNASMHRAETIRRDTTQINYTDSQALFFYYIVFLCRGLHFRSLRDVACHGNENKRPRLARRVLFTRP